MKLAWFRALGAGFGLVLAGAIVARAVLPNPGVQGPFLGDNNVNLYSLWNALSSDNQLAYTTVTGISTTVTQAACTQVGNSTIPGQAPVPAAIYLSTASGPGSVCLPTAFAGRELYLYNNTNSQVTMFASSQSVIPGTLDTINTVAGATGVPVATIGANAAAGVVNCIAMPASAANTPPAGAGINGGAWACQRGN